MGHKLEQIRRLKDISKCSLIKENLGLTTYLRLPSSLSDIETLP